MSKFKPGGVAYIVRPWDRSEDIGRPVTLIRRGVVEERVEMRNGDIALCSGPGANNAWLCDANDGEFPCFIAEYCLQPLGGVGEDAMEEMLLKTGLPERNGVAA